MKSFKPWVYSVVIVFAYVLVGYLWSNGYLNAALGPLFLPFIIGYATGYAYGEAAGWAVIILTILILWGLVHLVVRSIVKDRS